MKLNILYLYYDLLNLYGESGNIKALDRHLREQNIDFNIDYLTVNDEKDFNKYDLIYIGSGTERNLIIALNDLLKYKKELKKYIKDNKFVLATGNSIELFGKYILLDNKKYNCLDILNYYTIYSNRTVEDIKINCSFLKNQIIGFKNNGGTIVSKEDYLFENEGILKNNFFGTYIIGPLLIRNPEFCKYFIKRLLTAKNDKFKIIKGNYELEDKAYINSVSEKKQELI